MQTKEEILQQIKLLVAEGMLQKGELLTAYEEGRVIEKDAAVSTEVVVEKLSDKSKFGAILYYLGGAVVFLGIAIFLGQRWSVLNPATKISATLGSGIAAYYVGLLFLRDNRTLSISSAFFLLSALVMPLGLYVVFDHAGYSMQSYGLQSFIFAILFASYFCSYLLFKRNIFILFSVVFATGLFNCFNYFLIGNNPFFDGINFYAYLMFITGLSYLLLGHHFSQHKQGQFLWFFYGFGIVYFLGAAFYLGGWKPHQHLLWELAFPLLVFGSLFCSVRFKSKALLTFATLFLMAFVFKITAEYFTDSIGWSFSLVMAGLLMIAVGYLFFVLKSRLSLQRQ